MDFDLEHCLQFFSGQHFQGIGSPHTPANHVWPMALVVQGLTSTTAEERADMLRTLLKLQCGNGLMHESGARLVLGCREFACPRLPPVLPAVNVDNLQACTRSWFGWANSLLVAFVESATSIDCTAAAEIQRLNRIKVCSFARGQSGGVAPLRTGNQTKP
jgi:hypothetical protein